MAPPKHSNSDRHGDYHDYLAGHNFKDNPRLGESADRLSAWLEFLLHPETHDYDREVLGPWEANGGGPWVWRERSEREYNWVTGDGEEYEYRSVFHEYRYSHFLDPLVAVSTQQVEKGDSLLAVASAAINNIYWVGQQFTAELDKFPSEWNSPAAQEAKAFVTRLESVATQVNLVVGELKDLLPKYALVIKTARIDLNEAVEGLVAKFEEKFAERDEEQGGFSFDVVGFAVAVIAAAAVTYMTGGTAGAVVGDAIVVAWSKTFEAAATELFEGEGKSKTLAKIEGFWWKDLAKTYFKAVDGILLDAKSAMDQLNAKMTELAGNFEKAIPPFTDKLPQVDQAPA